MGLRVAHVLVPTDLSPESLAPCRAVLGLARRLGARVTVLHVVPEVLTVLQPVPVPFAPMGGDRECGEAVALAREVLRGKCRQLAGDVEVDVAAVSAERVAPAIVAWASEHEVDLIALSTHGRTGFRHFALGSVAEAVLRRSPVPVLCFPREG